MVQTAQTSMLSNWGIRDQDETVAIIDLNLANISGRNNSLEYHPRTLSTANAE